MGDINGFLNIKREKSQYRPVCERVKDYAPVAIIPSQKKAKTQASRCMDCGVPFCHWSCPVGNYIPEWNDAVFNGYWQKASLLLEANNNLPEVTGRVCPALCEYSCVLGVNDEAVTIRENELSIVEYAFKHKLIKALPPRRRTGKKVAVIGSGPAGLAAAAQLNRAGHKVVVYERDEACGGILRFGIPDFKLEKEILDRRMAIWRKEGVDFRTGVYIGKDVSVKQIINNSDAVCLACGSRSPRDLKIEGRQAKGIYFAMDYLTQANRSVAGVNIPDKDLISAKGKRVLVIGGGDTGSDCVGTAHRQGASCVVQIEIMPKPPECRDESMPWPRYPMLLKTSSSHEEGGERHWAVATKKFVVENGEVKKVSCLRVEFDKDAKGCPLMREIAGTEFEIEADMVVLALGFLHPEKTGILAELDLKLDARGNVLTDERYMTSQNGVFAAGDMRRGQSLVVWAISEGRRAAYHMDKFLMKESSLPLI